MGEDCQAPPLWLRLVVAATKSHGIWSARSMPVVGVGEPAILTVRDWPSRNQQFLTNGSGTGLGFWCSGLPIMAQKTVDLQWWERLGMAI